MKKKYIVILLIIMFGLGIGVVKLLLSNKDVDDGFNDLSQVKHENMLSMMLETDNGSGEYSLETRSSWPSKEDGYVFNSTLSKCEKGSKLRWDDDNNAVVMVGNTSDKCYVYFDKVPTLAEYVIAQYTGTQGENNLYYHNGTILGDDGTVLDAGDNSYRYAGSSDTTNNFVCFGTDAKTCPDDNLYRIIGVFGDQAKLIKWDYANSDLLGTDGDYYSDSFSAYTTYKGSKTTINRYYWNYANKSATYSTTNYYNAWSYSKLNTININENFINNIGSIWVNKIAETSWKVGGNSYPNIQNVQASVAYTNEITNLNTDIESTYKAKVALMYTSDYGFAASPSAWTTTLNRYSGNDASGNEITEENWMYMGLSEWTMVRSTSFVGSAGCVFDYGSINIGLFGGVTDNARVVRPVFHLESSVNYVSGTGTKEDSIRIN